MCIWISKLREMMMVMKEEEEEEEEGDMAVTRRPDSASRLGQLLLVVHSTTWLKFKSYVFYWHLLVSGVFDTTTVGIELISQNPSPSLVTAALSR